MKRKLTKLMAAFALLAFLAVPLGMRGQTRTEVVTYTLDGSITGGSSGYATVSEITQNNITWMVMGNTTMNPWRIGGKNLTYEDRPLYSTNVIADNVTKVVITNGTKTATVNSMTLIVSENADFSNPTSTIEGEFVTSSTTTFERPEGTDWSNMYYKLVYNITAGGSNQYAQFVKAEFYKEGGTVTPEIQIVAEELALPYTANADGVFNVTYTEEFEPVAAFAQLYNDAEHTVEFDGDWIEVEESMDEDPSIVTYIVEANNGTEPRMVYLYVEAMDAAETIISGVFPITQAHAPQMFTVNFNLDGGTFVPNGVFTDDIVDVEAGTYALPSATKEGFTFSGWDDGTTTYAGGANYTVSGDVEFTAQWTANTTPSGNEVVDVLNLEFTGRPASTSYGDWSDKTGTSGAVYAGNSAGDKNSIQLRSNNNNSGVVTTASAGKVTKVVVTWQGDTNNARVLDVYGKNTAYDAASDLYDASKQGDLLGSIAKSNQTTLDITGDYAYIGLRSRSGAMYLTEIRITWETSGTPVPSIDIENNDELAYNATSGSFNFTLNNPVDDGSLSISEDVDWMEEAAINGNASIGYSVTFTTTANEAGTAREGVITLTYTYNTSETVTKNVTVTQAGNPNATMTIAEVRAQGTGSVVTKGVVTHISGVTAYIQDATAAIVVYGSNTPVIGDEIRVEGVLSTYKGLLEIGSNAAAPTVTVLSQGNTVSPTVMTIEAINTDAAGNNDYQAKLVRIEEAVYNNGTVSQGASSITVYGTMTGVSDGDVVNFTANIGCYNSVQLVNLTDIEVQANTEPSITVATYALNVEAGAQNGTINVTYANVDLEMCEVVMCDANGDAATYDWIQSTLDNDHNITYSIIANEGDARTAYLKVCLLEEVTLNPLFCSEIVTVNQAAYVAPALDYATLPFAFDGGKADIETTDGLTQEGLDTDYASSPKLKFKTAGTWVILHFNETPGTLTFDIKGYTFSGGTFTVQTSEDGVTYTDLQTYTDTNFDNTLHSEQFNNLDENVRYIKWIYTEKSSGNVGLGNIHLYKVGGGPVLDPVINASDITMAYDQTEGSIAYTITNPVTGIALTAATDADWINNIVVTSEAVTFTASENTSTEARTATFTLSYTGATDVTVTVTQAAYEPPFTGATYTLATSIESGRRYIITNGNDKAMGAQSVNATSGAQGNNRTAVGIATVGNVAQVSSADVVEFVINGPDANGRYIIYDPSQVDFHGYLYAASNSSNHLKTRTFNSDANGEWIITFGAENNAVITAQGSNTHNIMRYNSSGLFSCYGEGNNQADVYLYVKDEETPTYTFYKDIAGYGASNLYTNNGYYLIATPVDNIDPVGTGMITDPVDYYDLYSFDQSGDEFGNEWINYKDMLHGGGFNLFNGKGYLYANHDNVTLAITGTPTNPTGSVVIPLVVVPNVDWSGKNLVGNPFGQAAYITKPYYRMNPEGNDFIAVEDGGAINPMEGIFVIANVNGEELTFTTTAPASGSKMSLNISGNRGSLIDRAIVRFGEGSLLPKFQLNPDNTKIYFTQAENDYAVVNSDGQGEMPVSFKAAEDGTYTLNINTTNAEMDYLHLLDNLTGADVDLLQTPEYTFDARTTDYASRFRLVFGTTQISEFVEGSASFAYFSNGNWVINNEGNATVQVVDVMGRVLSSETINGCANVNVNAAPGVYMLRLINCENVKTQKIVVR